MVQGPSSLQHKPRGWSLLHLAASLGQAASVKLLLKHKADVHGKACVASPADHTHIDYELGFSQI